MVLLMCVNTSWGLVLQVKLKRVQAGLATLNHPEERGDDALSFACHSEVRGYAVKGMEG